MSTCKTCKFAQFKATGGTGVSWIECLNPVVNDAIRLSFRHVHELYELPDPGAIITSLHDYTRVQFDEATFGCIHHEEAIEE